MYLEVKCTNVRPRAVLAEAHEPDGAARGHGDHQGHGVEADGGQDGAHLGVDSNPENAC